MTLTRRFAFAMALLFAMLAPCTAADMTIIYVTRHAEKMAVPGDPDLSPAGQERARNLAAMLKDAGITRIYTTKFARTRQTAAPLASALRLEPEVYDSPAALAALLKGAHGSILIVGHSNTAHKIVDLLGGTGGSEIDEMSEFDRLYQVIIGSDGSVTTVRMHSLPSR
jgi:phosphohistidine phosphatase SixA